MVSEITQLISPFITKRFIYLFSGSTALVFEMITLQDKGEWSCQGETGNLQKSFNMVINRKLNYETSFTVFFLLVFAEILNINFVIHSPYQSIYGRILYVCFMSHFRDIIYLRSLQTCMKDFIR